MSAKFGSAAILLIAVFLAVPAAQAASSREGLQKTFYPSGKVKDEINYKAGKLEGISKSYYEDGTLKSESDYVAGKMNGTARTYHSNGKLKAEGGFKDGKRHGPRKTYDEKQRLAADENYKMGLREGTFLLYNPETGVMYTEIQYRNDVKHGRERFYAPAGFKLWETHFVDGKKEGQSRSFSIRNGWPTRIENYKNDALDGQVVVSEKVERIEKYSNGRLID